MLFRRADGDVTDDEGRDEDGVVDDEDEDEDEDDDEDVSSLFLSLGSPSISSGSSSTLVSSFC